MTRLKFCLLALVVLACSGAQKPDPISQAEAACMLEVQSVIRTGACDEYSNVEQCPWFALAMTQCRMWLDEAQRQMEKVDQ